MISCKEAAELTSRRLDEPLSFQNRMALRFHVLMCSLCRTFAKQLAMIRHLSQVAGDFGPNSVIAAGNGMQKTLPPATKARLKGAISGKDWTL